MGDADGLQLSNLNCSITEKEGEELSQTEKENLAKSGKVWEGTEELRKGSFSVKAPEHLLKCFARDIDGQRRTGLPHQWVGHRLADCVFHFRRLQASPKCVGSKNEVESLPLSFAPRACDSSDCLV